MYSFYRAVTSLVSPFVPLLLNRRLLRGKEDAARMKERLGFASLPRPVGKLVWIHGASVGEANAIVPLIEALLEQHTGLHILLTTVTVTSAALMSKRLPARAFHQFAPVDAPAAVERFLAHWRPDVALWVDSELWPNLITATHKSGAVLGIINARMSERSFKRWGYAPSLMRSMLSCFNLCFAQSELDGERLGRLGISAITRVGNLKYDAPGLPFEEAELNRLRAEIGDRPIWLAASTHPGEEAMIADAHRSLKNDGTNPLVIIVPRHATRGKEIAASLKGHNVVRRSGGEPVTPDTDIYLADTMGELGLFYRLVPIVLIGGSLVPHGGHNPLEPARLGVAILAGTHMENFASIVRDMRQDKAIIISNGAGKLGDDVAALIKDKQLRDSLGAAALRHVEAHAGTLAHITRALQPYLA